MAEKVGALVAVAEEPQVAVPEASAGLVAVIQQLAARPEVDVTKLEKIIELQERIMRHQAKVEFDEAFAAMQGELPVIIERGTSNNGKYARLEDIIPTVRPILQKHGFSLSHETQWPNEKTVRVIGILTHKAGHEKRSEFLSAGDVSGNKNAIQGLGSALSYGRRYTTKDLLMIVEKNEDDDGRASSKPAQAMPEGFEDWWDAMAAVADEGTKRLEDTWTKSKAEYKNYVAKNHRDAWNAIKAKAAKVQA